MIGNTSCLDDHFECSDYVLEININAVEPHNDDYFVVKWQLASFEGFYRLILPEALISLIRKR